MMLWVSKDTSNQIFSMDPPAEEELDAWVLLTTRERHFEDIAKMLEKQVKLYTKEEDYRSARVARDLAKEIRQAIYKCTTVN